MIPKAGQCPDEVTVTGADVNTVQNFDQNVSRLHTALRKHISFNVTEMVKKKKRFVLNPNHECRSFPVKTASLLFSFLFTFINRL